MTSLYDLDSDDDLHDVINLSTSASLVDWFRLHVRDQAGAIFPFDALKEYFVGANTTTLAVARAKLIPLVVTMDYPPLFIDFWDYLFSNLKLQTEGDECGDMIRRIQEKGAPYYDDKQRQLNRLKIFFASKITDGRQFEAAELHLLEDADTEEALAFLFSNSNRLGLLNAIDTAISPTWPQTAIAPLTPEFKAAPAFWCRSLAGVKFLARNGALVGDTIQYSRSENGQSPSFLSCLSDYHRCGLRPVRNNLQIINFFLGVGCPYEVGTAFNEATGLFINVCNDPEDGKRVRFPWDDFKTLLRLLEDRGEDLRKRSSEITNFLFSQCRCGPLEPEPYEFLKRTYGFEANGAEGVEMLDRLRRDGFHPEFSSSSLVSAALAMEHGGGEAALRSYFEACMHPHEKFQVGVRRLYRKIIQSSKASNDELTTARKQEAEAALHLIRLLKAHGQKVQPEQLLDLPDTPVRPSAVGLATLMCKEESITALSLVKCLFVDGEIRPSAPVDCRNTSAILFAMDYRISYTHSTAIRWPIVKALAKYGCTATLQCLELAARGNDLDGVKFLIESASCDLLPIDTATGKGAIELMILATSNKQIQEYVRQRYRSDLETQNQRRLELEDRVRVLEGDRNQLHTSIDRLQEMVGMLADRLASLEGKRK